MFKRFATACLFFVLPVSGFAVPVASPVIDVPFATGEFISSDGQGDFLGFDAPAAGQGFIHGNELVADLSLTFDLSNQYSNVDGFFILRDQDKTLLAGVLNTLVPRTDMLLMSFTELSGELASIFGNGLAIELSFLDMLGDDPLAALSTKKSYDFSYVVESGVQPAPIPLPAGAVLLISSLGLLSMRRNRR